MVPAPATPYHRPVRVAEVAAVGGAYALGTFPSALVVGRRTGFDPTAAGSGNPGATNALRLGGRRAGAAVLLLDVAKGAAAAGVGLLVGGRPVGLAAAIAAVLGHVVPVTRPTRGGKGVATASGAALVLEPVVSIGVAAVFAAVAKFGGRASLASVAAAIAMPVAVGATGRPAGEVAVWCAIGALVVARHAGNLARLARGEEPATAPLGERSDDR